MTIIWRLVPLLLLSCFSLAAHAVGVSWVLGSFSTRAGAEAEASRLGQLLAVELPIVAGEANGQTVYRVTLDYHLFEREQILASLKAAGIEPWRMTLQDNDNAALSLVTGAGQGVYLLVTSERDIQASINTELAVSRIVSGVQTESRLEEGDIVHKVMVGPIQAPDLDTIRQALAEAGFANLERVTRGLPTAGRGYARLVNLAQPMSQTRGTSPAQQAGGEKPFNFARLRPGPQQANQPP
ncbi:MAG: SPOR domain-containing protein [Pseudomonadota bacterium]